MFANSQFNCIQENGFKYLQVRRGSENSIPLVLLHGLFGGLSNYDALMERLTNHDIYVPAIPIYEVDAPSIRKLSDWLHTFISFLDIDRLVLLGNSMGGHLALDYTIQYPGNIRGVVLTGSSGLQEKSFGSTCPRRHDREYIRRQASQTFYHDLVDESLLDDIMQVITNPSKLRNILALARNTHEYTMEKFLAEIAHDVLLIWGQNDQITPPSVARQFHQKLPNAQLRWIDKCGHAPMMEHPDTFALFLNEFLIELQNKRKEKNITDYEENYSHI
jgi:pimeloyl-ACP methyl ester carboxylesterase